MRNALVLTAIRRILLYTVITHVTSVDFVILFKHKGIHKISTAYVYIYFIYNCVYIDLHARFIYVDMYIYVISRNALYLCVRTYIHM